MRLTTISSVLALAGVTCAAASGWTFTDASVTVGRAADKLVEKFSDSARVKETLTFGSRDTLKVLLKIQEGSEAKRPHQAFLVVREASGLEAPFPLTVKESGKGVVQITHKDLPVQLLTSPSPLEASIVLGSAGATKASKTAVFDMTINMDPAHPVPSPDPPLRYGKLDEIHHIFRADPKNPPKIVSLAFAAVVLATVPALFIAWISLGGNFADAQKALASAPVSHFLFFGSIIAMEGVFLLYYSAWNLFQTLPVMGVVAGVAFLSGTKALGEVQSRRLSGQR